jgi:hypothetical protein
MAATRCVAKLLGDWEEVVVQVPAAVNQRLVAGKPHGQLGSNPAACGCHHRPGDLSDMREKAGQAQLAGSARLVPAG